MKARKSSTTTMANTSAGMAGLDEQIRARAYELYEQRGRSDGYALDDWLSAEAELKQRMAQAQAA